MSTTTQEQQTSFESLLNQKATIFKYSEMGFPQTILCEIRQVYLKNYAQYNDMLHIVYRPNGKRTDYVMRIYKYSSYLLYAGHVSLNADMFVRELPSNGLVLRESLVSFSNEYLDRAKLSTDKKPLLEIIN